MISKPLLYFIVIAVVAILGIAWWAGNFPARVTVINNSGADLAKVTVETNGRHVDLGPITNGGARSAQLDPGDRVTIRFGGPVPGAQFPVPRKSDWALGTGRWALEKSWTSDTKLNPAQSMIAYVTPEGKIELRSRLGALSR